MTVLVLGAGAWGTALAIHAAGRQADVVLWTRSAEHLLAMQAQRQNQRYLEGHRLPDGLALAGGEPRALPALAAQARLILVGTPLAGLRWMLQSIGQPTAPVVWLCKGFEASHGQSDVLCAESTGLLPHEVQQSCAPTLTCGALSGPSFAQEVARGLPTALVAASPHAQVRATLVAALHGGNLRVYENDDLVGVEVAGAVKNVLAIATGLCDGLALGANARAALITRGLAEISRLGHAMGARTDTFMGLSGLGDLVLTATGDLSRNRQVGLALARGMTVEAAVQSLGHVAEGVACARTVLQRAQHLRVDMPITACVVALLDGTIDARQAVLQLMGRDARAEGTHQA